MLEKYKKAWYPYTSATYSSNSEHMTGDVLFPSLLPMVKRLVASTIGLNLVSVNPLSMPPLSYRNTKQEMRKEKIKNILSNINSDKVISLKKYEIEKMKISSGFPLFYIDYQYGATSSI